MGWSKVFVHLKDADADMMPGVTVMTHVPYEPTDSYHQARNRALERATEIVRSALTVLENTDLQGFDEFHREKHGWTP
jgi:hypothetical protein